MQYVTTLAGKGKTQAAEIAILLCADLEQCNQVLDNI